MHVPAKDEALRGPRVRIPSSPRMARWWNGRHAGLKIQFPKGVRVRFPSELQNKFKKKSKKDDIYFFYPIIVLYFLNKGHNS